MKLISTSSITQDIIKNALSYSEFNTTLEQLFEKGETTDHIKTESYLGYTRLNIQRTHRWERKGVLSQDNIEFVKNINRPLTWVVLTEGWCGDSGQILPFINKMALLNDKIELKILLRHEYPEIMDEFLTDGKSRSIPKIIILDSNSLKVLTTWGPRPSIMQTKYLEERQNVEIDPQEATRNLHVWYARDKGKVIQQEYVDVLKSI